jgi:hypothetical protein
MKPSPSSPFFSLAQAKLTQLTELHCTNEELTDEGICHLSNLTELNTLALRDCCAVSGDALQVS